MKSLMEVAWPKPETTISPRQQLTLSWVRLSIVLRPERDPDDEITFFKTVGVAMVYTPTAAAILTEAKANGSGTANPDKPEK